MLFNKKVKCIVCQNEKAKKEAFKKYSVFFCSEKCLKGYEKEVEESTKDLNLDNCC